MIKLVFHRDLNEMRTGTAFRIMLGIAALITVGASIGISIGLKLQSWYGRSEAAPALDLILGLVLYFLPFIVMIAFVWGFTGLPIIKEKVNGNIECLMATPLTPRGLWLGKTLAIFAPAYLVSLLASLIVWLIINLVVILPGWGSWVIPGPALISGLVVNPLLFLALVAFIVLFSLAVNPDTATAPSFIVGFGLMIGVPVGLLTGWIDLNSWWFVFWYLIVSLAAWAIVWAMTGRLKSQNIVLSAKGG